MGTSSKISGPGLKGLAKSDNRVQNAETNTLGGGVGMHGGGPRKNANAGTDYRDGGSQSISAPARRVSNAPTNTKGS
jgi:hypothetical protein